MSPNTYASISFSIRIEELFAELRHIIFTFYIHSVSKEEGRKLLVALCPTANTSGIYHEANSIFHGAHTFILASVYNTVNSNLPEFIRHRIQDLEIRYTAIRVPSALPRPGKLARLAPLFADILNSKKKLSPSPTYDTIAPFRHIKILRLDILRAHRVPFGKIERMLATAVRTCALQRIEVRRREDFTDDWVGGVNRRTGAVGKLTVVHGAGTLASMSASLIAAAPWECRVSEWFWVREDGKNLMWMDGEMGD